MNKKLKSAVPALICGVCLAAALILPPMFRRVEFVPPSGMTAEERVAMFLDFMDGGADTNVVTLASVDNGTVSDCEESMEELFYTFGTDYGLEWPGSTGSEYLRLSDGEREMTVCRMWIEATGDWHSWMDAFFNAETGELYYLYVNSTCLYHRGDYIGAFGGGLDEEKCAGLAAEYGRESLKMFSQYDSEPANAFFTRNGDLICREIECSYYTSTFFELELSVK